MLSSVAATAHAQTLSVAEELRVNVHVGGAMLRGDRSGQRGVGPGASMSYGNTRWFTVFATYDEVPLHDDEYDYRLRHIDAGARSYLRGYHATLVPFVLGGMTWRSANYGQRLFLGDTMDVTIHGTGFTLGAGLLYYVAPRLAMEGSAKWTGGSMDRVTADNVHFRREESTIRGATLRLNAGVSWFPGVPHPRDSRDRHRRRTGAS
ncbi:hypothetical protein BH23GEM9_BH23GEM9_28830 [soil metagenome]